MRNRKVRILHEGHEYFLVDRGRTTASRVITLLRRVVPGDQERLPSAMLVKTDLGDCVAVANWSRGRVEAQPGHEELEPVFGRIVERYLEEFRVGRQRKAGPPYWFLSVERQALFTLSPAQPSGLSVLLFATREAAEAAAGERRGIESRDIGVEETGDLSDFLAARAVEGFAGATIDERDPVFFCLDAEGAPRFLRLTLDPGTGQIEHYLLQSDGTWRVYEGEEELTPEIDQDVIDQHMLDRLGDVPFLGYHEGMRLYRLARPEAREQPVVVELSEEGPCEGQPFVPVFHDLDLAAKFLAESGLEEYELVEVDDLQALAEFGRREGHPLLLQPNGHRARGGALWSDHGTIILDSFSGLWRSSGGTRFTKE